VTSLEFRQDL